MGQEVMAISNLIFRADKPKAPPPPEIPAAPAPEARQDTGAQVVVGADAAKDKRASGGGSAKTGVTKYGGDILGGLGKGGLNV